MKHLGLFEGIGGFDLAAQWMGWTNVFHCETNPFGQKILKHHFPEAEGFGDITKTDFTKYANKIDIITGGFPCQPYSVAGKRKGKEDERHLWPEMLRVIGEVQPTYVVGENVSGLLSWNGGLVFHEVQTDLEAKGYEVQPFILPACAKNAPHRRDRVWFIAYSNSFRNNRAKGSENCIWEQQNKEQSGSRGTMQIERFSDERIASDTDNWSGSRQTIQTGRQEFKKLHELSRYAFDPRLLGQEKHEQKAARIKQCDKGISMHTNGTSEQRQHIRQTRKGEFDRPNSRNGINDWENFPTQSPICGGNDGIPRELGGITFPKWRNESIKAFGNAIVPQVAYEIFKAIERTEILMPL